MRFLITLVIILSPLLWRGAGGEVFAQTYTLSGKISDSKKNSLPFSSVVVKGTTIGTNSNADGLYAIKLPAGTYEVIYQYIGYKKETKTVVLNTDVKLDVMLNEESYALKEVTIKAGEDPAYEVIRQAMKKRKYYLNQVNAYTCNAYIKGLQRLKDFPKNLGMLLKMNGSDMAVDSTLLGVIYLSESESKYSFEKPNNQKEVMYSSRVSGNSTSFSWNQLGEMKFSFYENLIYIDGLSDRPFISPINETAFLSYRYHLLGTTFEDGKMINKIEVIPKRNTDPCFHGIIYIQENTWRIHSLDMYLTKDAKIDFVDTLKMKQLHAPVSGDSIWMPINLNYSFNFKFLGFKGDGYFNAVVSAYEINPTFPKNFFKNEILRVEDGANKKDSAYWKENRPIPLTNEEVKDYHKKDSVRIVKDTKAYKDSIDRKANKFKIGSFLMGYHHQNTFKKTTFSTTGIINGGIQYNTVEGTNVSMKLKYEKDYEDYRRHEIDGGVRYGFSNNLWGAKLGWTYLQDPKNFQQFEVHLQSMVEQYNANNPIPQFMNTIYTLLSNDNYMKLYRKTSVQLNYRRELVNGLILFAHAEYAQRQSLINTSPYLWIDDKNKLFTSNDPQNPTTDAYLFKPNDALMVDVRLRIRFKQKYYSLPHRKINTSSKYPRVNIMYKKAIPIFNTSANYDLVKISVEDDIKLGLFGTFAYRANAGYFLNNKTMYFMDYQHFNGNQTILANSDYLNAFKLLPYYTYSTNKEYVELHAEHHFNGFIFNKIPLLKKTTIQEVIGAHALFTDQLKNYYEVNFGLENIFKIVRVDYVLAYGINGKVSNGFLIGLGISF
ncbi:MAG: DUF5686 and carboxypeptidase regulatory-like domain-containing protein [Bacteroidia bacterium]